MDDLKAAAERLRKLAKITETKQFSTLNTVEQSRLIFNADACLLATQALEALAWQAETGASVRKTTGGEFWCAVKVEGQQLTNNYYADTPLGAILAAMEGEKDGN